MDKRTLGILLLIGGALALIVARLRATPSVPGGLTPVQPIGTVTFEPLINVGPACASDEVMISGGICIPATREQTGLPPFGSPGTSPGEGFFFTSRIGNTLLVEDFS